MKFYSSGMISRLGFAIVLALEPDILLVDEVLSVGDLAFRRRAESAMDDLLSRSRCQIIVTHDLALVREHCTRCVLLDAGKIVALGDPSEVADHYEEASNAIEAGRLSEAPRSRCWRMWSPSRPCGGVRGLTGGARDRQNVAQAVRHRAAARGV